MALFSMKFLQFSDEKLMNMATKASIAVAVIITLMKFVAWIYTDSLSLLSSLVDSFLDIISSTINFIALQYALQPPDKEHRFGHNKAEDLATLLQALAIGGSAIFLIVETIHRFFVPSPLNQENLGIAIMIISLFLTFGLVLFQKFVVARTNSAIIKADALHYLIDFFTNSAVLLSLILHYYYRFPWIDSVFALIIAFYIFLSSKPILQKSFNHLMDHECNEEIRSKIKEIVLSHPMALGIHDLKTREAGPKYFFQLHLELDGNMTLYQAHKIADEIEEKLLLTFPNAEIIIHEDPEGVENIPSQVFS